MSPWVPANHGSGARRWFLVREDGSAYHYGASGNIVRYATYEAASWKAAALNAAEQQGEG